MVPPAMSARHGAWATIVGALAGRVSFRMQCLYHDTHSAAIIREVEVGV